MTLADLAACAALLGVVTYAVLGGADFGGGVWDALASGPRRDEQRRTIARAMGPVWEANHVWLIFVVVVMFTAFPQAWAAYSTAMLTPLHLAVVGIVLRGSAFVFRAYSPGGTHAAWGPVFGLASVMTPALLGASLGALSTGHVQASDVGTLREGPPWLGVLSLSMGAAGVSMSAYLAAVFLCVETDGELREDFRRRALASGTLVVAGATATIPLLYQEAPWLWRGLMSSRALPIVTLGTVAALTSGAALLTRRFALARAATIVQVACLVAGWGAAQYPFLIYPDLTIINAAAPRSTLLFLVVSLPFGLALIVPSMVWLMRVFKQPDAPNPPETKEA